MSKHITKIISTALVIMLVLGTAGCSQSTNKSKEFTPKYSSDTTYKLSVAGTYSNFESLESTFERFYTYYPNGEIVYTYLDDYSNTIGQALAGQEPPDIYVVQPWMYGDERFDPLFGAEVLSDPELNINLDCIRQGLRWEMNDGEILALPVFATSYGMLVNMDIFEKENLEVPKTFGELKETCEKLKAAGYASPVMGADTNTTPGIGYSFAYPMFAKKLRMTEV